MTHGDGTMDYRQMSKLPLFDGINEQDFPVMLGCVGYSTVKYEKGDYIILEQDHVKNVGVVLSGAVHMIKEDIWGNKTILAHIKSGELMGESFVLGETNQAKVTFLSAARSEVMFIPFDRIIHTCSHSCAHHRQLADNMVHMIANKNIQLMEKIEVSSKKSLREKIMAYLSIQAQRNDSIYFEIPLGRVELAEYLCADRSALTRELNAMRDEGMIDFDKNTFRILNTNR